MKKLYYLIWYVVAIFCGLFSAFFSRFLGGEGMSLSPLISLVGGAWLAEEYSVAILFLGVGGIVKDIFLGVYNIGLTPLFCILVSLGFGVIKYYAGTRGRWLSVLEVAILGVFLYIVEMVVLRGFRFSFDFLPLRNFSKLFWWVVSNIIGFFLCTMFVKAIARFIKKKVEE